MDRETHEEQWKTIPNTDGRYEVSNLGRVRSNRQRRIILTLTKQISGYLYAMVELSNGKQKNCRVNRLVAEAFLPNPNSLPDVNHKDGNKENNHVSNLEWSSKLDNVRHAWRNGLAKPHIFTEAERKLISERTKEGMIRYYERKRARESENVNGC